MFQHMGHAARVDLVATRKCSDETVSIEPCITGILNI